VEYCHLPPFLAPVLTLLLALFLHLHASGSLRARCGTRLSFCRCDLSLLPWPSCENLRPFAQTFPWQKRDNNKNSQTGLC
jgi:hypothetical protein